MTTILTTISDWFRPHLLAISLAILATILTIYGDGINRAVKKQFSGASFLVRLSAFVALCAFGYGFLNIALGKVLAQMLGGLDGRTLAPVIVAVFFCLGLLAERRKQI
jgi:hypothetical protein